MATQRLVYFAIGSDINGKTTWTNLSCQPYDNVYGITTEDPTTGSSSPILGETIHVDIVRVNKLNGTAVVAISGVSPLNGVPIEREEQIVLNGAKRIFIPETSTNLIVGIADLDVENPQGVLDKVNSIAGTDFEPVATGGEPNPF